MMPDLMQPAVAFVGRVRIIIEKVRIRQGVMDGGVKACGSRWGSQFRRSC
jgi:hypothetical protein